MSTTKSENTGRFETSSELRSRLERIEAAHGDVVALASDYPAGHRVAPHSHNRAQLLHALSGVLFVSAQQGRWMVPAGHAMWIPAGVKHAVEMLGPVRMRSVYVLPGVVETLPEELLVLGVTDLMRALIVEAVEMEFDPPPDSRGDALLKLLVHEIARLPMRPLGLPLPVDGRLLALCREFLENPTPHATIDDWAERAGMSRRSFTRAFLRETGLSLSTWRQQACLLAAMPRLADRQPITAVALDLGYESVPAFTTMFRRALGVSPRRYFSGQSGIGAVGD